MSPSIDSAQLGIDLSSARLATKRSLRDVAGAARISAAYLQKLERAQVAKPSPRILRRLSEVLDVSYARLMENAGYESVIQPHLKVATPDARLATTSLSESEERAVAEFIRHLIEKRDRLEDGD